MPELTVVPSWDGKGVTWRPIFDDDSDTYVTYTHCVEYAKSGRGKCGGAVEKIAKDTVRVGEPLKYRGGDYGWISKWMHPSVIASRASRGTNSRRRYTGRVLS